VNLHQRCVALRLVAEKLPDPKTAGFILDTASCIEVLAFEVNRQNAVLRQIADAPGLENETNIMACAVQRWAREAITPPPPVPTALPKIDG